MAERQGETLEKHRSLKKSEMAPSGEGGRAYRRADGGAGRAAAAATERVVAATEHDARGATCGGVRRASVAPKDFADICTLRAIGLWIQLHHSFTQLAIVLSSFAAIMAKWHALVLR